VRLQLKRTYASFRTDRGTSLVEAALITPLLLLLTFSIIDFASMFYVYLALENGVSQASRFAVTGNALEDPDEDGELLSREDSIKLAMRDATPTLTIEDEAFSFSHLPAGTSTWVNGTGGPNDIEKVTVNYTWSLMTPLVAVFFDDGHIDFTVEGRFE
jgi:Flp pilus assembly protein TadG